MWNLWKANTMVFMLQLFGSVLMYCAAHFGSPHLPSDFSLLAAAVVAVSGTVICGGVVFKIRLRDMDERETNMLHVSLVALLAAVGFSFVAFGNMVAASNEAFIFAIGGLFAFFAVGFAYALTKNRTEMTFEPLLPTFVMLLPSGLGTILGGVYFLNFYRKHGTFST